MTSYIGHNSIDNLQQILHQMGQRSLFLVHGGKSYENCGARADMERILKAEGLVVTKFSQISPNPLYSEVLEGLDFLKQCGAHIILAVGGGSILDAAKLMRHMAAEQGHYALLLAVPTTAGTGAEVTRYSIVVKEGTKQSLQADDILPDYAFVNPHYIYNIKGYLAACTGFDALAHALESYWSRNANGESKGYARKAVELLWNNLPKVVENPTPEVCDAMAEGSYWGGRAINVTKTTAPHAFSYAFTTECGYPHGHAVALTFPYFFGLNLRVDDPLVDLLGLDRSRSFEQQMREYIQTIGLGFRGCGNQNLSDLLARVNMAKLANNPVEMDEEKMKELEESIKK